jgi:hypothetical protein
MREFFLEVKHGSPTIVSIAIKNLNSGQVQTFALCDFETEQIMLETYFQFLENNRDGLYVHWTMTDTVYGFEAICNRYKQLTGKKGIMMPGNNYLTWIILSRKNMENDMPLTQSYIIWRKLIVTVF